MTRILIVSPGSTYSTTDVYDGLVDGFSRLNCDVIAFDTAEVIGVEYHVWRHILDEAGMSDYVPPDDRTKKVTDKQKHFGEMVRQRAFRNVVYEAVRSRADLVLFVSGYLVPSETLEVLSNITKTAVYYTESPYEDIRQLRQASLVTHAFVNEKSRAPLYETVAPGGYLPVGWHQNKHKSLWGSVPFEYDVVFVGVGYPERIEWLEAINWTGIRLGLFGDWQYVANDSPLQQYIHQGIIDNTAATELYIKSRIGVNLFRQCADYWGGTGKRIVGAKSLNPRSYELAACGVPQLSEWREEWDDVFGDVPLDTSCKTPHEMGRRLELMMAMPDRELAMLAAEQHCAVAEHSYYNRAASILERTS